MNKSKVLSSGKLHKERGGRDQKCSNVPDIVASCDLNSPSLDSLGILSESCMADFSIVEDTTGTSHQPKANQIEPATPCTTTEGANVMNETYNAQPSVTRNVKNPVLPALETTRQIMNETVSFCDEGKKQTQNAGPSVPSSASQDHSILELTPIQTANQIMNETITLGNDGKNKVATPSNEIFIEATIPCHSTPVESLEICLDNMISEGQLETATEQPLPIKTMLSNSPDDGGATQKSLGCKPKLVSKPTSHHPLKQDIVGVKSLRESSKPVLNHTYLGTRDNKLAPTSPRRSSKGYPINSPSKSNTFLQPKVPTQKSLSSGSLKLKKSPKLGFLPKGEAVGSGVKRLEKISVNNSKIKQNTRTQKGEPSKIEGNDKGSTKVSTLTKPSPMVGSTEKLSVVHSNNIAGKQLPTKSAVRLACSPMKSKTNSNVDKSTTNNTTVNGAMKSKIKRLSALPDYKVSKSGSTIKSNTRMSSNQSTNKSAMKQNICVSNTNKELLKLSSTTKRTPANKNDQNGLVTTSTTLAGGKAMPSLKPLQDACVANRNYGNTNQYKSDAKSLQIPYQRNLSNLSSNSDTSLRSQASSRLSQSSSNFNPGVDSKNCGNGTKSRKSTTPQSLRTSTLPRHQNNRSKATPSTPDLVPSMSSPGCRLDMVRDQLEMSRAKVDSLTFDLNSRSNGMEAMTVVIGWQDMSCKAEKEMNRGELEEMKKCNDNLKKEVEQSKNQQEDFNKLLVKLKGDIDAMCRKHQEEKESLNEVHRSKQETLRLDIMKNMKEKREVHEEEVGSIRMELTEKKELIKNRLIDIGHQLTEKKVQLEQANTENEELKSKVELLEEKVSTLVINLMKGPDHRAKDLQKEVDSLTVVIDVKNKDLRETREFNLMMETKLRDNDEMKGTVRSLKAHVEDMKEQLDRKKTGERKLTDELSKLQCSVDRKDREKRRLFLEKEQFQWKIRERTPIKRLLSGRGHSHSFSEESLFSNRNLKENEFQMNSSFPLGLASPPSMIDIVSRQRSVSYQLDLSENSFTDGGDEKDDVLREEEEQCFTICGGRKLFNGSSTNSRKTIVSTPKINSDASEHQRH